MVAFLLVGVRRSPLPAWRGCCAARTCSVLDWCEFELAEEFDDESEPVSSSPEDDEEEELGDCWVFREEGVSTAEVGCFDGSDGVSFHSFPNDNVHFILLSLIHI